MSRTETPIFVLLLLCSIVFAAGCAGTREAEAAVGETHELPDWVRIAVPERDGRSLFVGGVSAATDLAAGLEAADTDARSQVHQTATRRFTDSFNSCVQKSNIETTPVERLEIKNSISHDYGTHMSELARLDDSYHRPCDGETGEDGPVCQVFVLLSVGAEEWDMVLTELLSNERRRRAEDGQDNVVAFLDYMMRDIREETTEQGRRR
jgi:hypothetical protein